MLESLDWFAVLIHQKDFKIPSYILGSVLTRKTVFQEGVNLSSIGTVDISLFEKDELIFCSIEVGLGCKLTNFIMSSLNIPVLMLERILPRKATSERETHRFLSSKLIARKGEDLEAFTMKFVVQLGELRIV